jgi:hypothetical protein
MQRAQAQTKVLSGSPGRCGSTRGTQMRIKRTFIQKIHMGSSWLSVQAGSLVEIAVDPVHAR